MGNPVVGIALVGLARPEVGIPVVGIALVGLARPEVGIPVVGIAPESGLDNRLAFSIKIFRISKF